MALRYWVGGTATWNATAGNKWSLTSGGAGGQAVPTGSDEVYFDAASGVITVTISAGMVCKNLHCTGFTGTLTGGDITTPSSSTAVELSTGGTYTGVTLSVGGSSTGPSLTFAGKTIAALTISGATTCVDAINVSGLVTLNGRLSLKSGTVNAFGSLSGNTQGSLKSTTAASSATLNVANQSLPTDCLRSNVQDIYSSGSIIWVNTTWGMNDGGNTGAFIFSSSYPFASGFMGSNF